MTVLDTTPARAHPGPHALARRARYALGVLPAAVGGLTGSPAAVARQRRRVAALLGADRPVGARPVPRARAAAHGLLGVVLGLLGWVLAFFAVSGIARGPFYGLVVPGPYDGAWGGPGLAGAWAVHAGVWVATLPVLVALTWGLAGLHARLTARLLGPERRAWVPPVTALVVAASAVFLVAWAHQV